MIEKHEAIRELYPTVVTIVGDVAYDANDNEVPYDNTSVNALVQANQYQRDRAAEYPPMEEQLDYIYHNGIETWKADMILPVKDKYPKQ